MFCDTSNSRCEQLVPEKIGVGVSKPALHSIKNPLDRSTLILWLGHSFVSGVHFRPSQTDRFNFLFQTPDESWQRLCWALCSDLSPIAHWRPCGKLIDGGKTSAIITVARESESATWRRQFHIRVVECLWQVRAVGVLIRVSKQLVWSIGWMDSLREERQPRQNQTSPSNDNRFISKHPTGGQNDTACKTFQVMGEMKIVYVICFLIAPALMFLILNRYSIQYIKYYKWKKYSLPWKSNKYHTAKCSLIKRLYYQDWCAPLSIMLFVVVLPVVCYRFVYM